MKGDLCEPKQHAFYLKEPGANRSLTDQNQHAPVRLACFDPPGVMHWEVPNIVGDKGTTLTNGVYHLFIVRRVEVSSIGSSLHVETPLS